MRNALPAGVVAAAAFVSGWLASEVVVGVLAASSAAVVGAVWLAWRDRHRMRRLARQLEHGTAAATSTPAGASEVRTWAELEHSVQQFVAGHDRRSVVAERERAWRHELVDSLLEPALLFTSESRLLAANTAARELLELTDDAAGRTVVQALGSAALADGVREARSGDRPVTVDVEHAGHRLRAVASPVGDETLLLLADRTRELHVEELRRNFVVNASHELKTPVTSIQTLSEALQLTLPEDPDRAVQLAGRLDHEAERLAKLVRDLLDLRRLEERGVLERAPVDVAELVRRVVAEQGTRAAASEIELRVDAPAQATIVGIPGDLEVVVQNLVANAVKYNRPGGRVEVTVTPEPGRQVLTVTDTGIGIPQQDLARIFERFYRVDVARSRQTGGTGLGLSIVRHAVERHGGSIEVRSTLGRGTTFTVTLPVEPPT